MDPTAVQNVRDDARGAPNGYTTILAETSQGAAVEDATTTGVDLTLDSSDESRTLSLNLPHGATRPRHVACDTVMADVRAVRRRSGLLSVSMILLSVCSFG